MNKLGMAVGLMVIGVVLILFAVFQHVAQGRSPIQIWHGAIIFGVLGIAALAGGVATYMMKGKAAEPTASTPTWAESNPADTLP